MSEGGQEEEEKPMDVVTEKGPPCGQASHGRIGHQRIYPEKALVNAPGTGKAFSHLPCSQGRSLSPLHPTFGTRFIGWQQCISSTLEPDVR